MGIVLVGPGMVGKTLLTQLNDQMSTLEKEFNVELKVRELHTHQANGMPGRANSLVVRALSLIVSL
jgi:homoserine dehydrogenase